MKKSLVLAMAMALGVTASAYAANPFSDVPAGHWAYDSIDQLVAAGVVEGMPNGNFEGGRNMTRYEMAQIVAKAMAKGAKVEKLVAEFAEELDKLGVRVANLEKKADNVTITGQIRYDYTAAKVEKHRNNNTLNRLQTRLWIKGQINEDWTYTGRIQVRNMFDNDTADNTVTLNQAWVGGRIGGVKVRAGRIPVNMVNGYFWDDTMEAVEASYGKSVKFTATAGKAITDSFKNDKIVAASVSGKVLGVDMAGSFIHTDVDKAHGHADKTNADVFAITAAKQLGDFGIEAAYLRATKQADAKDRDGFVVGLKYKGANAAKPGSWGLGIKYYDQSNDTYMAHTIMEGGVVDLANGFKGMNYMANYCFAKNILGIVEYNDMKDKAADSHKYRSIMTRLQFAF